MRFFYFLLICSLFLGFTSMGKSRVFRIYFQNDLYNLDHGDSLVIKNINQFCGKHKTQRIIIIGYCDDNGTVESNAVLSKNRAEVVGELIDNTDMISVMRGAGSIPIEKNNPLPVDSQRYYNRCTEVTVVYEEGTVEDDEIELFEGVRVGEEIALPRLLFIGNRHVLLPSSEPVIEDLLAEVLAHPKYYFEIQGHVCCTEDPDGIDDDTGTMDLSVQRAKMVYEYLIDNGVEPERLTYKGYGSSQMTGAVVPTDRRVVLLVTKIE